MIITNILCDATYGVQRNQRGISGSLDRAESLITAFMRIVPKETTVALAPIGSYRISAI